VINCDKFAEEIVKMSVKAVSSKLNQSAISTQPGYSPAIAYLLGQCCLLADQQYLNNVQTAPQSGQVPPEDNWAIQSVTPPDSKSPSPWNPDFSQLNLQGITIKASNNFNLSVYEIGSKQQSFQIPAGFIVRLDLTDTTNETTSSIIVVAFHGTQNSYEWNKIDESIGYIPFAGPFSGFGSVHAGFYKQYTIGSDGTTGKDLPKGASGSLADQVWQYLSNSNNTLIQPNDPSKGSLPVYVTGHSLGGALATLSALDIAYNASQSNFQISSTSMYSLASPRVAAAPKIDPNAAGTFVSKYQAFVKDSYRIVNKPDKVPQSPPAIGLLGLQVFAHVLGDTDAINANIVSESPLYNNVQYFASDYSDPHNLENAYVAFLKELKPLGDYGATREQR
jgi:lipase (class 3)